MEHTQLGSFTLETVGGASDQKPTSIASASASQSLSLSVSLNVCLSQSVCLFPPFFAYTYTGEKQIDKSKDR